MLDALLCSTLGTDDRLKNQILRGHEYFRNSPPTAAPRTKNNARDALVRELGHKHASAVTGERLAVRARRRRRHHAPLVPVRGRRAVRRVDERARLQRV